MTAWRAQAFPGPAAANAAAADDDDDDDDDDANAARIPGLCRNEAGFHADRHGTPQALTA
ncbi:MAG: hypothetical protein LBW85_10325 [Deltaproteobacteria bacterium]|jgi:hypothetical protein|nr:hypothetical protein [Deltaproteobacteria bacterium]